jgi:cytochrome oxidase Cu insertion factor (SCO1/SenC/PrrC family)
MARLAFLFSVVVLAAACGGGAESERAPSGSTAAPATGVELEGETLDGQRLSLADFRGKPVFVNVWASW